MSRSIIITLLVACVRVRGEKDKREKAGCVFLERERGGNRRIVCGLERSCTILVGLKVKVLVPFLRFSRGCCLLLLPFVN